MTPKLLVLVSPQGDAMHRDVFETCVALRGAFDVLALVPRSQRRRYGAAGIATKPFRAAGFLGMATSISTLRRAVRAFGPDVVHAHGFPAVAVALGTFPSSLARRTVATFHDPQRDRELPQRLVERKLAGYLRRGAAIVATYPSLARTIERRLALEPESIRVIPHGVDVPSGAPLGRPPGRPGPIVGWRGYLTADRSWETAIDAFALIVRRYPAARLVLSGSGGTRQFVAAQVRHKNLTGSVTFSPDGPARDVFANVDLLVTPVSRDAQPHAPLEALVWGVPVVAANVGALAAALADYETGWLVPDDAAGFDEGVAAAWDAIDAAWAGAAGQRADAAATYGREVTVAAYRTLLDGLSRDAASGPA